MLFMLLFHIYIFLFNWFTNIFFLFDTHNRKLSFCLLLFVTVKRDVNIVLMYNSTSL